MFKRLFTVLLISTIGVGAWAYYKGLRLPDLLEMFAHTDQSQIGDISPGIEEEGAGDIFSENQKLEHLSQSGTDEYQPLPSNSFDQIDRHARNAPDQVEENMASLANYLAQPAKTEIEKARAIYVWLAENIRYDDDAFNTGNHQQYTPANVLESRSSVCDGFSKLFVALGNEMDLEVIKVPGYSKGFGYRPGSKFKRADHAWNVVSINGKWRIFDATWGQGNGTVVNGKLVSIKEFDDYWFDVDPYEAIFNHYPEDPAFAFVQPAPTLKDYERMPRIEKAYFDIGFDGGEAYTQSLQNPKVTLPLVYSVKTHVEMKDAPALENLALHESYYFDFYVPRGESVAIIDAQKNWTYLDREFGRFTGEYTPTVPGELHISTKHENGGKSYHSILKYRVSRDRESI